MKLRAAALVLTLGGFPATPAVAAPQASTAATEFLSAAPTGAPAAAAMGFSRVALPEAPLLARREPWAAPSRPSAPVVGLGAERARILLRSLTLPGWGQATLGRRRSAKLFALAETGVWTSFVAFRVQEALRRQSSEVAAQVFAGIDLGGRDEEFRRVVGIYPSSDDYNLYVVRRDAAEIYLRGDSLDDPVAYRQYIADHELKGKDSWSWESFDSFRKYGELRKLSRRAALRANAMLGLAIANRLLSAVHAARHAGATAPETRSWNLEYGPRAGDPTAMALGVRVRF